MTHRFALVTSSYRGDLERCRLLCDSIDRFVTGFSCHYLLVESADTEHFRSFAGPHRRVISERDLLPWWLRPFNDPLHRDRRLWLTPVGPPLRGWHIQQLRRIAMAAVMEEDVLVSLDSDVVFVKPFEVASLAAGKAVRFYRAPGAIGSVLADRRADHAAWSRRAARLLAISSPQETDTGYIATLIAWRRDTVCAMLARIEASTGRSAFAALAASRHLSECTIYGRFVDEVEDKPERHRPSPDRLCEIYWGGPALDERGLDAFLANLDEHQVAIGLQSFTGTDPRLIRAAVGL